MRFSIEWQDPGVSASAELRATFCLLGIDMDGKRISRFYDERYSRAHDRIAMPAYPPAQGFVRFWWSLMAGRSGRIPFRRFRDGFALPDVHFEPDGRYVDITAYPFEYHNPAVSFVRAAQERVPIDEFERDISEFVESVTAKLSDNRLRNSWLTERWASIQTSLEDEEERLFCEAAGALGIDPYTCSESEAGLIEEAGAFFGKEGLPEFLASQRPTQAMEALKWLAEAEKQVGSNAALPDLAAVRRTIQAGEPVPTPIPETPWKLGYAMADSCRSELGLAPDRVLENLTDIAALFGGQHFESASGRVPGLRAEVQDGQSTPKIIVAALPVPQARTFAMMRAIGDFLVFDQDGRAPITDTYSYRQGVGRAFAVEMLAPAQTILQMEDDGLSTEEIAAARNVSEVAIAYHLQNHRAALSGG